MIIQDNQKYEDEVPFEEHMQDMEKSLISKARASFITKVYLIVALQLTCTSLFVIANMFIPEFAAFQASHTIIRYLCILITVVTLISIQCVRTLSQKFPQNLILLTIFTLAESYAVACISALYTAESILFAAIVTASATIGLTLYAIYSKADFTTHWHSLNAIGWGLLFIVFALTFLNVSVASTSFLGNLLAIIFGLIYMIYLVIDTQLIMDSGKHSISLDDYVLGAIFLYIDIIGLFLQILRIFGSTRD